MDIPTTLVAKAERLVDAGRVVHVKGLMYQVEGFSGTYSVHLSYPQEASGVCDCPSREAVCSHILAASIVYLADPPTVTVPSTDPFEGII